MAVKKKLDTRKTSLRFYRTQKQFSPPQFLNDKVEPRRTGELEGTTNSESVSFKASADKVLTITMTKKSIFFFFFMIALVAILCFSAGFLLSYLYFGPKPSTDAPQPSVTQQAAKETKTTTAKEAPAISFSLELAQTDDLEAAQQMSDELKKQKLNIVISTAQNEAGRNIYSLRAGQYSNYTQAHRDLQKLPQPFSLWGKVVKMERHGSKP